MIGEKRKINCHGTIFWGDLKDYFFLKDNIKSEEHLRRFVQSPSRGIQVLESPYLKKEFDKNI